MKLNLQKSLKLDDGAMVGVITLEDLYKACAEKIIVSYEHNRGETGVAITKAREIAENFDINKFGTITLGKKANGTYKVGNGHHRLKALVILSHPLRKATAVMKSKVFIRIIPETQFLAAYAAEGLAKPHTNKDKATNPDLMVGTYISYLKEMTGFSLGNGEKWLTVVNAGLAYDQARGLLKMNDLKGSRAKLNRMLNTISTSKNAMPVSKETTEALIKALNFVKEFYHQVDKASPKVTGTGKTIKGKHLKLRHSTGLLQLILVDHMSQLTPRTFTNKSSGLLAQRAVQYSEPILQTAAMVARQDGQGEEAIGKTLKYLTGNNNKHLKDIKWTDGE